MSNAVDDFLEEALRLAKVVKKEPDTNRLFNVLGEPGYRERVKYQKWKEAAARLAFLLEAMDDYIRNHGSDGEPALPARWKGKKAEKSKGKDPYDVKFGEHPADAAYKEWVGMLKQKPPAWREIRQGSLLYGFRSGWDRGLYEWRTS